MGIKLLLHTLLWRIDHYCMQLFIIGPDQMVNVSGPEYGITCVDNLCLACRTTDTYGSL
ncbi:hypothetical protein ccbrp13_02860 [Ktedonobacteria bacterium brp13]|nr:hypothetical protein ccbrp13_02860 [Ktedonobacteria bacterium brp13]